MEKRISKISLFPIILAFLILLPTLFLLETTLKYFLYFFEVILILLLFHSFHGKKEKIRLGILGNTTTIVDYGFLFASLALLVLTMLKLETPIAMVIAILVSFFLPGYVLLRLINFESSQSWIEWTALSVALSIGITSIIFTAMLFTGDKAMFISAIYVCLSVCPILRDRIFRLNTKLRQARRQIKTFFSFDIFLFLWIVAFFVFAISTLYPQMSLRPGLDIVRQFSSSRLLALSPDAYSSPYPWFQTTLANIQELSSPSIEFFQTGLAFLSLLVIAAFYIMAKAYLTDFDKRAPIIATVVFSVFAGFGWIYFLQQRIVAEDITTYSSILTDAQSKSYFDTGYAQGWLWFWFRPLTIGLTLFFVLLYLLREHKLRKGSFMLVFTTILLALNFVHFPESVVFTLFLMVVSLLRPMREMRLSEATTSSVIAMLASLPVLIVYQEIVGTLVVGPSPTHLILLAATSATSYLFVRIKRSPKIKFQFNSKWLLVGAYIGYLWLLITWFSTAETFETSYVTAVYSVPWQFYPMLLGLSGLFAIYSSIKIIKDYSKHPAVIFVILLLFAVLFGRALTFYNANVGDNFYGERRIVPIAYGASAIVGSLAMIQLSKRIQKYRKEVMTVFLSFIVILSMSSTFLALELQIERNRTSTLNNDELNIINNLNELSPNKVLLTVTDYSRSVAEFTPSSWIINNYRDQLWSAKYPELPLTVLYSMNKPVTIFLREPDLQAISQNYASSYLFNHLALFSSPNTSTNDVEYVLLPNMTAPTPNSQTLLVLPDNRDPASWYAYSMLSQANFNFSTALVEDIITISKAKTLIASTEGVAEKLLAYRELFELKFENLIILNLDGYNKLALNYFYPQTTISLDSSSKELATLNENGAVVENLTGFGVPTEFEVQPSFENGPFLSILEDNVDGWNINGIEVGNISAPQLSLNEQTAKSGEYSIQIDVSSGTYAYWQIRKDFSTLQDADSYDFISFYWNGKGDGKKYVLQFHSNPSSNYWYYFTDSWNDWKKVIIPLHVPDGNYNLNGVDFVKVTNGEPTWKEISRIDIRNHGSSPNISGTFLIDKFGFESAETISVNIVTKGPFYGLKLLNHDGTNWVIIAELASNEIITKSSYVLTDALSSTLLFGDKSFLNIVETENAGYSVSTISFKLPPKINGSNLCAIKLKIVPIVEDVEVDKIKSLNYSLKLNSSINVSPIENRSNAIAWYVNSEQSIPFAVEENIEELRIIHVNIYPLSSTLISDKSNYDSLVQTTQLLNLDQMITTTQIQTENPVRGNLAAFSRIDFDGDITIQSSRTVIVQKLNNALTLTSSSEIISDISKIVFIGDETILNIKNGTLQNGMGFYANIFSDDIIASRTDETIATIMIEFDNNTRITISEPFQSIKISGSSITTLRQPTLQINGKSIFYNLNTYASISDLGIIGKDAALEGQLSFEVAFGDEQTVVTNFEHTGNIITNEFHYDELKLLYESLPLLAIIAIIYLIGYGCAILPVKNSGQKSANK